GHTSKWLRAALGLPQPANLLSKGYFACTAGKSERDAVERYLEQQGEHHGYAGRAQAPVYVRTFPDTDEACVRADHAVTLLRFHLVLGTWRRRGVFAQPEAQAVTETWQALGHAERFTLLKVSFVPDHVHVAVRTHPAVAPGALGVRLMNVSQEVIWARC